MLYLDSFLHLNNNNNNNNTAKYILNNLTIGWLGHVLDLEQEVVVFIITSEYNMREKDVWHIHTI